MSFNLNPGALLGRYRLLGLIAQGGMGAVWRARDEVLERAVAVKVLPEHLIADDAARRRFEREARVTASLVHPNIVTIFDVGSSDAGTGQELPYLVMELLEGRSLLEWLKERALPGGWSVRIATQVASALGAAHAHGVIHRDLKPSNVMVLAGNHVKVLDFGLARLVRSDELSRTTLTTPGMVLGSCPYMSPEQALGGEIEPNSDVFSLGAVLYEMLAGHRAFRGPTPVSVLEAVVKGKRESLDRAAPFLPEEVVAIVERCLDPDPARRYPNGNALERDLVQLNACEMPGPAAESTPTLRSGTRLEAVNMVRRRVRRRWLLFTAGAALAALLLGFWTGLQGREPLRPDPGSWSVRSLASLPGPLRQPSWTPDGKELAVNYLTGGHGELLIVDVKTGGRRELVTGGPGEVLSWPRFSPDGRLLAVTVTGGASERVEVLPALGGPPIFSEKGAARVAWDSSGLLLVARYEKGSPSLWKCDLASGKQELALPPQKGSGWWDACSSADGRLALLGGSVDVRGGLWVMAPGKVPEEWLEPGARLSNFGWAPGGRSLIVVRDGTLVRVSRNEVTPVIPALESLADPAVSPEGRRLAIVRERKRRDILAIDPQSGTWECRLCGVEGAEWAAESATGSLFYSRRDGGTTSIFKRTGDGGEERVLPAGEDGTCPAPDPTGRLLAYIGALQGSARQLRVTGLDGGSAVTLATGVENAEIPAWSPDGSRVAYAAGSPLGVWVASTGGGAPNRLADGDYPRWSPDGKWISYVIWTDQTDPDQGLWVVHPDGSGVRKLGSVPTRAAWERRGRWLWQLRRAGEDLELWRCLVDSWSWQRAGTIDLGGPAFPYQEFIPFTVEPTTGNLLLHVKRDSGELLLFEGLDPRRW